MPRLLFVLLAGLAFAPSAWAQGYVEEAATALRSDPVYVHPDAESALSDADAEALRERIASSNAGPLYIAIVPAAARNEAGGDAADWLRSLAESVGRRGTYAVVVGKQFRAGSTVLDRGEAARLATEAFEEHRDDGRGGDPARLRGRSGCRAERRRREQRLRRHVVVADPRGRRRRGARVRPVRRRRRARRDREALTTGKAVAQEDMLALADDIRALDLDVEMPDVDPDAKEHYGRAVEAYERADRAYDTARRPEDLAAVSSALEEGRYEMASAKARLEGREAPERRPPCFFDPRHGPSDRNVMWARPAASRARCRPAQPTRSGSRRARSPSSVRCSSAVSALRTTECPD